LRSAAAVGVQCTETAFVSRRCTLNVSDLASAICYSRAIHQRA